MKMADNEIIKALECCIDCDCKNCPCQTEDGHCLGIDEVVILDLINRQKAEIDELKATNEDYKHVDAILHSAIDILTAKIKSDAINEFALKLISGIHKLEKHSCEIAYKVHKSVYLVDDVHNTIDSIVKEMTEVSK